MSNPPKKNDTPNTAADTPFVRYDDYWLKKARTLIDGTVETFTKRLDTLNKFLNYLAAGTFLGSASFVTYTKSTDLAIFLLAVIPLVFIAIAKYYVAVKGSEPAMADTNMRSPSEINEDYGVLITQLSDQIREAGIWVALATFFTLFCLPFAMFFHNVQSEIKAPGTYVSIQNVSNVVQVRGLLPKSENVSVILYGKSAKKKDSVVPPYMATVQPTEDGDIIADYKLKEMEMTLDSVRLEYKIAKKPHRYTYKGNVVSAAAAKAKKEEPKKPKPEEKKTDSAKVKKTDKKKGES